MRKLKLIIVTGLILQTAGCVGSSVNNTFKPGMADANRLPAIEVADLEGREYMLPGDLPARYNLLALGFAHEQKEDLKAWIEALKQATADCTDCALFKMPVIDGANAALRTIIRNGMRSGTPEGRDRQRTLTLFADLAGFLASMQIPDASQVRVMLLDKDGRVLAATAGNYTEEKIAVLIKELKP